MDRNEVLYLSSERKWISQTDLAANPGLVLITEEMFNGVAPTVEAVVQAMVNKVSRKGTIRMLSFQCHGFAGGLVLWGGGLSSVNPNQSTTTTSPGAPEKYLASQ